MDTVEESGGTYFYHGNANVTPQELFLLIFAEGLANHLGVTVETAATIWRGSLYYPSVRYWVRPVRVQVSRLR